MLPVAVCAGMSRKISAALRNTVDGEPVTQGTLLELEAKHYFNYYGFADAISFDAFLSAISCSLASVYPGLNISLEWIRQCDRRAEIVSAKRELSKLRAYADGNIGSKRSFWEILWKLTAVFVDSLGLSYREIGTLRPELTTLSRRYLLKDGVRCVERLANALQQSALDVARKLFLKIDCLLTGTPMTYEAFRIVQDASVVLPGSYAAYRKSAAGFFVQPVELGLALVEHTRLEAFLFPDGKPQQRDHTQERFDPTALATAEACIPGECEATSHQDSSQHAPVAARSEISGNGFQPSRVVRALEMAIGASTFEPSPAF